MANVKLQRQLERGLVYFQDNAEQIRGEMWRRFAREVLDPAAEENLSDLATTETTEDLATLSHVLTAFEGRVVYIGKDRSA